MKTKRAGVDAVVGNALAHRGTDDDDAHDVLIFTAVFPPRSYVGTQPFEVITQPDVPMSVNANDLAVEGNGIGDNEAFKAVHDAAIGQIRFRDAAGWSRIHRVSSDRSGIDNPKYEDPSMEFFKAHGLGHKEPVKRDLGFMNLGEEIFIYRSRIDDVYSVRSTHKKLEAPWQSKKRNISETIVECKRSEQCTKAAGHRGNCRRF